MVKHTQKKLQTVDELFEYVWPFVGLALNPLVPDVY